MSVRHLAVVGLGLIGGSLARALRAAGEVGQISGYDADPQQRQAALKLGVVDHAPDSAAAAVQGADLVVLAVPVLRTAEALAGCIGAIKPEAIITDVGSTKQSVLADIAAALGAVPARFVAAHPIAGTEKSGVANSLAELFRHRRVVVTPHPQQDRAALQTVTRLWQSIGSRVVEMTPAQHDAIFAATSHLPHVLAFSFVDMLARQPQSDELFPNAGGGFRDFTRIASSSPQMWHDIVRANADAVVQLLGQQIDELQQIRRLIDEQRWDELKQLFERARAAREHYLSQIE